MAANAEKRKSPRVTAKNVSAHLVVADQSSPCTIQNISSGGLFIETIDVLPPGMSVAVNLSRPGWSKALRVSGRVVWALAEKTAAKKGTVPGMRIKFDPLSKETVGRLLDLLHDLGASGGAPPPQRTDERDSGAQRPISLTDPLPVRSVESSRISTQPATPPPVPSPVPHIDEPAPTLPRSSAPKKTRPSGPRGNKNKQPRLDDSTMLAKPHELPPQMQLGSPQLEAPKLIVQVQGLIMQLGDLQQLLDQREREIDTLRRALSDKDAELERADRERKAAELAIQRLSMQLAARR